MPSTNYFWQGGRKLEIEYADDLTSVQANSISEVEELARTLDVPVRNPQLVAPGLVSVRMPIDRDGSMQKLRQDRVVHHIYQLKNQPENSVIVTDSFFVKFKEGTSQQEIDQYFKDEHLTVQEAFPDGSLLLRVSDETGRNPLKTANLAANLDIVEYAEPNLIRQLQRFAFIPTDTLFSNQWHLNAPSNGQDLIAGADIKAPAAWDLTRGIRQIVVCVADDGFDLANNDFKGPDKVFGTLNAIPDGQSSLLFGSDVLPKPGDYHGTPCAGVAIAENNGVGTVGVAPGCAFLAVRFPLNISDAQLAKLFERISTQADVVSCSWGFPPSNSPMSMTLRNTITQLAQTGGRRGKGLIFCVAAGNNNSPIQDLANTQTYRYRNGNRIVSYSGAIDRWIAAHPDVITVSASTSLKTRAAYSSWGKELSICAPSNNFDDLSQRSVRGLGIWTTDNEGYGLGTDFTAGSMYTGDFGGTSSATPTVAGVCALVLSANSNLSGKEVKQIIQQTASKDLVITSETPVNVPGDFDNNGFSQWFGYGKVDAEAAVKKALSLLSRQTRLDVTAQDTPIEIPDRASAVESQIQVDNSGVIAQLRIDVSIRHTYIGDLVVDLISPDGTSVNLHNQQGGAADDINAIYDTNSRPALQGLTGKSIKGIWKLRVRDSFALDSGRIESWRLVADLAAD